MVQGFIFARHAGIIFFAKSPHCQIPLSVGSGGDACNSLNVEAIESLIAGEIQAEHIVCDMPSSSNMSKPVICMKSYSSNQPQQQQNTSTTATVIVTAVMIELGADSSSSSVVVDDLKKETLALNEFAYTCVCACTKHACESLWESLFNDANTSNNNSGNNEGGGANSTSSLGGNYNKNNNNNANTLYSNASRSVCGLPRALVDQAVPLSFCFVPPSVLGGETLNLLNRHPPAVKQERIAAIHASMPWQHDDTLTEHITDTMRIFSSFVADSAISDVPELLESRFACELIPPVPALSNPKDPRHASSLAVSFINANDAAQSAFFGRGTWFTGLFSANDGAVVSATNGFFRLAMEDQILISTLVSQAGVAPPSSSSGSSSSSGGKSDHSTGKFSKLPGHNNNENDEDSSSSSSGGGGGGTTSTTRITAVKYNPDIGTSLKKKHQQQQQQQNSNNNNVQATTLPPQLKQMETHVRFRVPWLNSDQYNNNNNNNNNDSSSSSSTSEGTITIFTIDDNLRFVVGMPKHRRSAGHKTTTEIASWTSQLLENSLQHVSAREVATYCSTQTDPDEGAFGFCLALCGSCLGSGEQRDLVPAFGLRKISYLTPGLLRHYCAIITSSISRARHTGRYFGVGSQNNADVSPVRLIEGASFFQGATNANSGHVSKTLRYFLQFTRSSTPSLLLLDEEGEGEGDDETGGVVRLLSEPFSSDALRRQRLRSLSLLNAHPWSTVLQFSDLVMLDNVAPTTGGLVFGLASASSALKSNFTVASFSALGTPLTAERYQWQTAKANESARIVHASLQSIAYSAIQAASTPTSVTLASAVAPTSVE